MIYFPWQIVYFFFLRFLLGAMILEAKLDTFIIKLYPVDESATAGNKRFKEREILTPSSPRFATGSTLMPSLEPLQR